MIKNMWYPVLESKEVGNKKPIGVTRLREKLVFWRDSKKVVHCIYDQCCHRGASLSLGCINNDHLACPFHGFEYNENGGVTLIPANGKNSKINPRFHVHSFTTKEQYGFIWVWYSDTLKAPKDLSFFDDLKTGYLYKSFKEIWTVHYTRAAENQLDVVHLPFVHKTTIGKGNRTLVHGPVVKWEENLMHFYVYNVVDDGNTIPLKPNEIKDYQDRFQLQFLMPNLWQNIISESVRVFAAFVPIDDENTMIYLRFYQKFLTVPLLGGLITQLSNIFNRKVLHQDRLVVLTQLPKKTELRLSENLIQGDLPIIEFRKKREELMKTN